MDDLTSYEKLRLDNIRRNELFMQSLGLGASNSTANSSSNSNRNSSNDSMSSIQSKKRELYKERRKANSSISSISSSSNGGIRKSSRLQSLQQDKVVYDRSIDENTVDTAVKGKQSVVA